MINVNHVVLVGRLTKDIDLRKTNSNASVCSFTLAIDRRFQSQQPGAQTATVEIYGTYGGKRFHTTGDMNECAKYLNRYGKIIYGINENNENAQ